MPLSLTIARHGRLARVGAPGVDALADLYDIHAPAAYRCALAIVGDPKLAEAALETGFLQISRAPHDGMPDSLLAAVYRAAAARRPPRATSVLDALPPAQRDAIALTRFGGLSVSRAAGVLGTTREQVERDLLHGLRAVRGLLSGDAAGAAEGVPGADR